MAMGRFDSSGAQAPMAEINTTPLVDVMLVLLIIFIITAPLMTHTVQVDLPRAASEPTPDKPLTLPVSITADGEVFLDGEKLASDMLEERFREAIARDRNAELHLMADRAARYGAVAETMSAARRAGVTRIGFVTQPEQKTDS
ncbi:MAG: biopolymer transporter ExbD [Candidatus Accumulibacter sp.]|jgi:biopolymer transport protein ExbD|nr:biopolymer transporter ExbD [Accumulibacter sp.]